MTFTPEVWDGVVRRLRSELPPYICDAFIENLAVDAERSEGSPDRDSVRILCPTPFHRDRVRDQYRKQICASFAAELGHPVSVEIVVAERGIPTSPAPRDGVGSAPAPAPAPKAPRLAAPEPSRPYAGPEAGWQRPGVRPLLSARPPFSSSLPSSSLPACSPPSSASPGASHSGARASTVATSPAPRRSGQRPLQRSLLRAKHTFDSFVVGDCNALAREASLAVLRDEDPHLDQLFLCGGSGLGKTHLARAVCTEARAQGRRPVYTSAEAFTNEFLASLRSQKTGIFKRKFRQDCDVLVVEDVGFLQGKESTQLEFFHTVQHVRDAGGRVVFTSSRLPQALPDLDPRVRSQMSEGFLAEMAPPDALVRRDILRAKASAGGVHLPDDCLELLVERVHGSVRDLESVLIQLVTTASLLKKKIDVSLTREALDKKGAESAATLPRLQVPEVLALVAHSFQTTVDEMGGRSRRKEILVPRQLAVYLCRRYTDASLSEIGRALNRDHPSVRNAIRKVERAVLEKAPLRYQVEELARQLEERSRR